MGKLKDTNGGMELIISDVKSYGTYDVVVVGGGIAGIAAAISSGKRGYKTLLIEATSALGGLVTMGLVNIPLSFICGLGKEMIHELKSMGAYWHRNFDPEKQKLVLDRMMKKYHCDVLLVTPVIDAVVQENSIKGVIVATKTGPEIIYGKRFIDCSGDSDAAFYAGAETVCGRKKDGMSQGASLDFIMGGVDWDTYLSSDLKKEDPRWEKALKKALDSGELPYEIENHLDWMTHLPGRPRNCGKDEVVICLAHSRNCFPTDNRDLTRMYMEGREQVEILSQFVKNNIPGFENSYLSYTASLYGVRESRRIIGEYILNASDIANYRKFDDVICITAQGYDIHNYDGPGCIEWAEIELNGKKEYVVCDAGGFAVTTTPPPDGRELVNIKGQTEENAVFEQNGYYDIPYRCLVAKGMDNLLMAGRNLSSDVSAQSGARLIMACLTMGEAAGTAAAMSLYHEIKPGEVDYQELQRVLVANGVNIGQRCREIPALKDIEHFEDKYYKEMSR